MKIIHHFTSIFHSAFSPLKDEIYRLNDLVAELEGFHALSSAQSSTGDVELKNKIVLLQQSLMGKHCSESKALN